MNVLGIICLIVAGIYFSGAQMQNYVTHQLGFFLGWIGFGLAGMLFLVLGKLGEINKFLKALVILKNNEVKKS